MKALILAAGYGTRLYPLTINLPKPLLLVSRRPMINFLLDKLVAIKGLKEIYVVTNDKFSSNFEKWRKHLEPDFRKLRIKVLNDGTKSPEDRRGAIGDIQFAISKEDIRTDLLVLGGDNLFTFGIEDFICFARKHSPRTSIGLFDIHHKEEAVKFGVVKLDQQCRISSFLEKPGHPKSTLIAMCLYYFPKESLGRIGKYLHSGKRKDASGSYISWLYKQEPVFGYVFYGEWFDIGHIDSYSKAKKAFTRYIKEVKA